MLLSIALIITYYCHCPIQQMRKLRPKLLAPPPRGTETGIPVNNHQP